MKAFLAWLMSPSRAHAQAISEIEYLRVENQRLNDLLLQFYEQQRVVPVQRQHLQEVTPEIESSRTLGEQQMEFADQKVAEYRAWQREEAARLERMRQINEQRIN